MVNPPWAVDGRIGVRAGSRWPFTQDAQGNRIPAYVPFPFFLATAAALLKREGYEVLMVDAIAEGLYDEEFVRRLKGFRPDLIVQEIAAASHEVDLDWVLRYKEEFGDDVNAGGQNPREQKKHQAARYSNRLKKVRFDPILRWQYRTEKQALPAE